MMIRLTNQVTRTWLNYVIWFEDAAIGDSILTRLNKSFCKNMYSFICVFYNYILFTISSLVALAA